MGRICGEFGGIIRLIAAGLPIAAWAQITAPVPPDPAELVTGEVQTAYSPDTRQAALDLLARARDHYNLRAAKLGYDLKVSFTVTSDGQTRFDGVWQMEDIFHPQQDLRWTAKASAGFSTTQVSDGKSFYGDQPDSIIPLRLHQARAALFGPIATPQFTDQDLVRTAQASFNGTAVTCVLLSGTRVGLVAGNTPGRRWEESEDCIDPRTNLLVVHSPVPGYYQIFDYSEPMTLGASQLPHSVTITEGGKTVMQIRVESLSQITNPDPSLFVATEAMTSKGSSIRMAEARKFFVNYKGGPVPAGSTIRPVIVFGLIAPSGQLEEAHSLQPSDPNSAAAIETARKMKFRIPATSDRPEQHFAFVLVRFVS